MKPKLWGALLFAGWAASTACGSDDDKSGNTGSKTDGGSSTLDGGFQCERTRIPAYQSYAGPRVWTEADRDACEQHSGDLRPTQLFA